MKLIRIFNKICLNSIIYYILLLIFFILSTANAIDISVVKYDMQTRKEIVQTVSVTAIQNASQTLNNSVQNIKEKINPASLLHTVLPKAIIPPVDGRTIVYDTELYPWRCICKLYLEFPDQPGVFRNGTGAIIQRGDGNTFHVLTAAHCLYDPEKGGWVDSIKIVPGLSGDEQPFHYARENILRFLSAYNNNRERKYDFALITLDRCIGNITGAMGMWAGPAGSPNYQDILNGAGYPIDINDGTYLYRDSDYGIGAMDELLIYNIDAEEGQSGMPIYIYDPSNGRRDIVAVHGGSGYLDDVLVNAGARLTNERISLINQWMDEDDRPVDLPDLIDADTDYKNFTPNTVVVDKDYLYIWTEIKNVGIKEADPFTISFYAVPSTTSPNAYFIGALDFTSTLAPFETARVEWESTVPSSIPEGDYWVGWFIDSEEIIDEYEETNNHARAGDRKITIQHPPTPTPTPTATQTPTITPTNTYTHTPTETPSLTKTPTSTWPPTLTITPTRSGTQTPEPTPTNTNTSTPTYTPSFTPTFTVTPTHTPTATPTDSPTPTNTPTNTPTLTPTITLTPTPFLKTDTASEFNIEVSLNGSGDGHQHLDYNDGDYDDLRWSLSFEGDTEGTASRPEHETDLLEFQLSRFEGKFDFDYTLVEHYWNATNTYHDVGNHEFLYEPPNASLTYSISKQTVTSIDLYFSPVVNGDYIRIDRFHVYGDLTDPIFRIYATLPYKWIFDDNYRFPGEITVESPPVAAFNATQYDNLNIYFDASPSFDLGNDITKYQWDFGDGTTTEGIEWTHQKLFHQYKIPKKYNVMLTVTDNDKLSDLVRTEIDLSSKSIIKIGLMNPGNSHFTKKYWDNNVDVLRRASTFRAQATITGKFDPNIHELKLYLIDNNNDYQQINLIHTDFTDCLFQLFSYFRILGKTYNQDIDNTILDLQILLPTEIPIGEYKLRGILSEQLKEIAQDETREFYVIFNPYNEDRYDQIYDDDVCFYPYGLSTKQLDQYVLGEKELSFGPDYIVTPWHKEQFLKVIQLVDYEKDAIKATQIIVDLSQGGSNVNIRGETKTNDSGFIKYATNPQSLPSKDASNIIANGKIYGLTWHEGQCNHIATVVTAMLRSLGIPCRGVVAWNAGTDRIEPFNLCRSWYLYNQSQGRVLPYNDLKYFERWERYHVWNEVYLFPQQLGDLDWRVVDGTFASPWGPLLYPVKRDVVQTIKIDREEDGLPMDPARFIWEEINLPWEEYRELTPGQTPGLWNIFKGIIETKGPDNVTRLWKKENGNQCSSSVNVYNPDYGKSINIISFYQTKWPYNLFSKQDNDNNFTNQNIYPKQYENRFNLTIETSPPNVFMESGWMQIHITNQSNSFETIGCLVWMKDKIDEVSNFSTIGTQMILMFSEIIELNMNENRQINIPINYGDYLSPGDYEIEVQLLTETKQMETTVIFHVPSPKIKLDIPNRMNENEYFHLTCTLINDASMDLQLIPPMLSTGSDGVFTLMGDAIEYIVSAYSENTFEWTCKVNRMGTHPFEIAFQSSEGHVLARISSMLTVRSKTAIFDGMISAPNQINIDEPFNITFSAINIGSIAKNVIIRLYLPDSFSTTDQISIPFNIVNEDETIIYDWQITPGKKEGPYSIYVTIEELGLPAQYFVHELNISADTNINRYRIY